MKYLSKTTINDAWKSIVEIGETKKLSLNKFFGILELLRHIDLEQNRSVVSNCQYSVLLGELSNSLQDKYFFSESNKKVFSSKDTYNIIFPDKWVQSVFQLLLKSTHLSLQNVAVICLQNDEFEDNITVEKLTNIFLEKLHLIDACDAFFTREENSDITFENHPSNRQDIFRQLKADFNLTDNTKNTIGFDQKLYEANSGELSRGPFIQTLYSGQENLKYLLLANFNILEYYQISSDKNTDKARGGNKISNSDFPCHQIIFYGSPGTGKSREVEIRTKDFDKTRATFHPETDYQSFVGCYKPVMDGANIKYEFVPQAFTKAYCNAWLNPDQPYFLIIEEINRGNCAQIFGDLFQCLDRADDGFSKYEINCDKDLANHLKSIFEKSENTEAVARYLEIIKTDDFDKIILPENLFIFATMNTSDQSLFPMDSAFKRRWDWEFVPINYDDANTMSITIDDDTKYNWGTFISTINPKIKELTGSEDKQLGNRFVNPKDGNITFDQFKSKVLFYLWSEVYKDEHRTQNSIFKYEEEDNNPIDFQFGELYNDNAKELVKAFLKFNGVEPEQ